MLSDMVSVHTLLLEFLLPGSGHCLLTNTMNLWHNSSSSRNIYVIITRRILSLFYYEGHDLAPQWRQWMPFSHHKWQSFPSDDNMPGIWQSSPYCHLTSQKRTKWCKLPFSHQHNHVLHYIGKRIFRLETLHLHLFNTFLLSFENWLDRYKGIASWS